MLIKSSPKTFNGYKCNKPENTISLLKKGLDDLSLHTKYIKRRVHSRMASLFSGDLHLSEINFSTTGKGTSEILAEASAYAEMAERISTGFFYLIDYNPEDFYEKTMGIIERRYLKGFHREYANNTSLKDVQSYVRYLNSKQYDMLIENGLIDIGVDAYDPIHEEYTTVPITLIDFIAGSNGLASGNTLEEAITQASCEAFERYAVSKILTEKIICPTIDNDSIKNKKIRKYLKLFNELNIEVILKDFSLNKGLPVIGAFFINHNFDNDENPIKKIFFYEMIDAGSSVNLEEAILRSLTERVQETTNEKLTTYKEMEKLYNNWHDTLGKTVEQQKEDFRFFSRHYICRGKLSFLEKGTEIEFKELKSEANKDFLEDCERIFEICKQNNWEMNIVDFTHKILRFPAIRVIIKPISIDYDPFIKTLVGIYNDEKRFNFFYGINEFYKYVNDDKWLRDKDEIKNLIENIEKYLSLNLPFYKINIVRGLFYQPVNLFKILSKLYLSIGEKEISEKYAKFNKCTDNTKESMDILNKNPFKPRPHSKSEKDEKTKILDKLISSFY